MNLFGLPDGLNRYAEMNISALLNIYKEILISEYSE